MGNANSCSASINNFCCAVSCIVDFVVVLSGCIGALAYSIIVRLRMNGSFTLIVLNSSLNSCRRRRKETRPSIKLESITVECNLCLEVGAGEEEEESDEEDEMDQ